MAYGRSTQNYPWRKLPETVKAIGYGDALSIISVLAQELPSVENTGIWRFGSTLRFVDSLIVCEMGDRRALGSSAHRPTPDAERQISLVGLQSTNTGV